MTENNERYEEEEPRVTPLTIAFIVGIVVLIVGALIYSSYHFYNGEVKLEQPAIEQEVPAPPEPPKEEPVEEPKEQPDINIFQSEQEKEVEKERIEQRQQQEQRIEESQEPKATPPPFHKNGNATEQEQVRDLRHVYDSVDVGMTENELRAAIGEPTVINTTGVKNYGYVEAWIYSEKESPSLNDVIVVLEKDKVELVVKQAYTEGGNKAIEAKM
jgi:hypothetical protein